MSERCPDTSIRRRLLGVLAVAVLLSLAVGLVDGGTPPDVHIMVVESLSADHLQCYGYERDTMPGLCSVASDGVLFEHAYSQGTRTTIAMPTLITGRQQSAVAVESWDHQLGERAELLPEILARQGYRLQDYQLDQDFLPLNASSATSGPAFSWLFYPYAHYPFGEYRGDAAYLDQPREPLVQQLEQGNFTGFVDEHSRQLLVDLYDSALRGSDRHIQSELEQLREQGEYNDSLIIITGDHAELMGEDGIYGHGNRPTREQVHVPLIIKFPGNRWAGSRIETVVGHIDIVPTVLHAIGIPEDLPGTPLQQIIQDPPEGRAVTAARKRAGIWAIMNRAHHRQLAPARQCPVEDGRLRTELCERYQAGAASPVPTYPANLSDARIERLKDLGYLD